MRDRNGMLFLVNLDNFIDACFFLDGRYEPADVEWLHAAARRAGCRYFVDVGAHIGIYTVTFASDESIQHVISFEPDTRNYAQLAANIAMNRLTDKVIAHNAAVSDISGAASLFPSDVSVEREYGKLNTGTSSLRQKSTRNSGVATETVARRIDDVVTVRGEAVAIKIDVEGHELAVLEGMRELLSTNQCVLLCEVWDDIDARAAVDSLLNELGYVKNGSRGDNHLYSNAASA